MFTALPRFCSALSVAMGIKVRFQQTEYEVARGDPVAMTCTFQTVKPNSDVIVVTWSADADDPTEPQVTQHKHYGTYFMTVILIPTCTFGDWKIISFIFILCFQIAIGTYFYPKTVDINTDYEGRVTMANDVKATPGVSTLSFSSVTMNENRVFQCSVQIPGDNDGEPSDTTRLVVLGKK